MKNHFGDMGAPGFGNMGSPGFGDMSLGGGIVGGTHTGG
jgi:hypothetical protein